MSRTIQKLYLSIGRTTFIGLAFLIPFSSYTFASQPQIVTGAALVDEANVLTINGQRIALWGLDPLASDQQCWQGNSAWCCGEEAIMALKHQVDGKTVTCEIQRPADKDTPAIGKCYRIKGQIKKDIAEHLIRGGWALDRGEASGGAYFNAEHEAQTNKNGVWSGRFQTAQDWKDGVQRFVGEDDPSSGDE